ncbi:MAG: TonB family protein [Bacteroidales bacterium]|nr:TonB family protein [Bacteroidales bacterium]
MKFLDSKEKKIGFYTTVIFHLVVLIIFLLTSINRIVSGETSFVLDFSKLEEYEKIQQQEEMKAKVSEELDNILSGAAANPYRNVAVDRSGEQLKDDRFKNPNQVYDEARALQERLDASREAALREQGSDDDVVSTPSDKPQSNAPEYKGPSVLSYQLDGRKAIYLPVPVYKCYGGGDVYVQITVNRKGYVTNAQIIESASSPDECLHKYAIEAAKRSRFTAKSKAPDKQIGEIVYRFIAQ